MNIIELINKVGMDKLNVQWLSDSISGAAQKKGAVEIKFMTTQLSVLDVATGEPKMCGLVVWFPADVVKEAVKQKPPSLPPPE